MAQDVVGRRDVKEELRNAERQQQQFSGECSLGTVLERESDFLVGCGVDLGARQALQEIDRRGYPRLEFGDEATLFRLAGQLEQVRPWKNRLPPVCA